MGLEEFPLAIAAASCLHLPPPVPPAHCSSTRIDPSIVAVSSRDGRMDGGPCASLDEQPCLSGLAGYSTYTKHSTVRTHPSAAQQLSNSLQDPLISFVVRLCYPPVSWARFKFRFADALSGVKIRVVSPSDFPAHWLGFRYMDGTKGPKTSRILLTEGIPTNQTKDITPITETCIHIPGNPYIKCQLVYFFFLVVSFLFLFLFLRPVAWRAAGWMRTST